MANVFEIKDEQGNQASLSIENVYDKVKGKTLPEILADMAAGSSDGKIKQMDFTDFNTALEPGFYHAGYYNVNTPGAPAFPNCPDPDQNALWASWNMLVMGVADSDNSIIQIVTDSKGDLPPRMWMRSGEPGFFIDWQEVITTDTYKDDFGKVKMKATSAAAYLKTLLDGKTISEKDGALYVRKLEGQTVTITEINRLAGVKSNIQEQLDTLAGVKSVYGVFDTKAAMDADDGRPQEGQMALVRKDEDYGDRQTTYVFLKDEWEILAEVKFELRDFTEEPIDLEREVTGVLPSDNIDDAIARTENVLTRDGYASDIEGVVARAKKLEGQTVTVEDLNYAGKKAHEHGNSDLLDSLTEAGDGTNFLADDGTYKKNAVKINPSSANALEDTETGLKVDRQAILDAVLNALYPVGSVVLGSKPAIGTWTQVGQTKILSNSDDQYIVAETGKYTIGEIEPASSKYYTIAPTKTGYDCIGIIPSFGGGTYYSQCEPLINFGGSATARTCTVSYWNNSGTLTAKDMYVGWTAIYRSKYGTETVTKWKRTA